MQRKEPYWVRNKERRRAQFKDWLKKNKEKNNKRSREWKRANPESTKRTMRNSSYKKLYGITLDDYNKMRESQGFKCAICKKHEEKFKNGLHVDHCHKTGKVRGLLCVVCNTKLGWYETHRDDIIKYL